MYKLSDIFTLDNEYPARAEFCNKNGLVIAEINPIGNERRFQIQKPEIDAIANATTAITQLQIQLTEYKYDIEQSQLFDMPRDDIEEKKKLCRDIIAQIRNYKNIINGDKKWK